MFLWTPLSPAGKALQVIFRKVGVCPEFFTLQPDSTGTNQWWQDLYSIGCPLL